LERKVLLAFVPTFRGAYHERVQAKYSIKTDQYTIVENPWLILCRNKNRHDSDSVIHEDIGTILNIVHSGWKKE